MEGFYKGDVWENQFFEGIDTQGLTIPIDDPTAYQLYPQYNWMYNKIQLMYSFGVEAYPHGIIPSNFPIFSKPITNLWGMGDGARVLYEWRSEDKDYVSGHFWMPYFEGQLVSTDYVLIDGEIQWHCPLVGHKDSEGSFTYWEVTQTIPSLKIIEWFRRHLSQFTGIVNVEAIEGNVIELTLRMSSQFVDLYGDGWLDCVVELYKDKVWNYAHRPQKGYSCPLYVTETGMYHIEQSGIDRVLERCNSVQITCIHNEDVEWDQNDEYKYRLAIVNGFDLNHCKKALKILGSSVVTSP